jgi:hypothetical protein
LGKNEWIKSYLNHNIITHDGVSSIWWHLNGKNVCKPCWLLSTTIIAYKLKHCFAESYLGTASKKISPRLETIIAWLETYFDSVCEKMPVKDEYYLPSFIFWANVLEDLNFYLYKKKEFNAVSLLYFSQVWYSSKFFIF